MRRGLGRDELHVDLCQHALQHLARRHPARGGALAQQRQFLLHAARIGGQPRQQLFHLRHRLHRHHLQQLGQLRLRPAQRAQAHATRGREGRHIELALLGIDEHVQRNTVGDRQAFARDGARIGQETRHLALALGDGGGRGIGQAIAITMVAAVAGELGESARAPCPLPLEKRVQVAGLLHIDVVGGQRRQGEAGRSQQTEQGAAGKDQGLFHLGEAGLAKAAFSSVG